GQIREGIRYVRRRTDIVVIMVVVGVVSTFGLNFQLTSAMMAKVEFGMGPGEYGILGSVLAIGSLTGALLAARRERPRVRLVIGSAFGFAVATGVMALMPTYASFALACIPVGLASLTMMTAANSTIQMSVDPVMRGRVMSLYMIVFLGATPVGSPLRGWIAEAWAPRRPRRRRRRRVGRPQLAPRGPIPRPAAPAPRRALPRRRDPRRPVRPRRDATPARGRGRGGDRPRGLSRVALVSGARQPARSRGGLTGHGRRDRRCPVNCRGGPPRRRPGRAPANGRGAPQWRGKRGGR